MLVTLTKDYRRMVREVEAIAPPAPVRDQKWAISVNPAGQERAEIWREPIFTPRSLVHQLQKWCPLPLSFAHATSRRTVFILASGQVGYRHGLYLVATNTRPTRLGWFFMTQGVIHGTKGIIFASHVLQPTIAWRSKSLLDWGLEFQRLQQKFEEKLAANKLSSVYPGELRPGERSLPALLMLPRIQERNISGGAFLEREIWQLSHLMEDKEWGPVLNCSPSGRR